MVSSVIGLKLLVLILAQTISIISKNEKYKLRFKNLFSYNTDKIFIPASTCIFCSFLFMTISGIYNLIIVMLINILFTALIIAYMIPILKVEISLLKPYFLSMIHGEFTKSQIVTIKTNKLRNTPPALFSSFVETF